MSIVKDIAKKSREKIETKVSNLSPLEKITEGFHLNQKIDKAIDKKAVTVKTHIDKTELKEEVKESAEKPQKKVKKSLIKRGIKAALGILGFGIGKEILSKKTTENVAGEAAELLTDDEKLKAANDKLQEQLDNKNSLLHKLHHEKDPAKKAALKAKIKKYRDKKFGIMDMMKDTWKETAVDENGKKRGFLSHLWHSIGKFFSTNIAFYFGVKKAEKAGLFKLQEEAEELKREGKELQKSAKEKMREGKQLSRASKESGVRHLRKNKIPAKDLVKNFEKEIAELKIKFNKGEISAEVFGQRMEEANVKLFREAKANRQVKPLLKLMKKGKVPGMELPANFSVKNKNPAKNLFKLKVNPISMAVSVAITKAVLDGKEKSSWKEIGRSLVSKETLTEAFVPGVGTWRSLKRNWNNSSAPTWLKITDVGLNVVGDVMLAAGYIGSLFSFGGGAAVGVAGRTAVVGLGKRWLTREGVKIAAKQAGKAVVTKEGRKMVLNSAKKSVMQGVKTSAISTPIALAAQKGIKKMFSKDRVNEAFNDMLTDEQKRSIRLTKQLKEEGEYIMAA